MSKQHERNLEPDWSDVTEDTSTEVSLEEASLLQAVEVTTEAVAERQRRISAKIQIPYSVESVWQVLTDYESLADFIPNLTQSRRLEHPSGGIRLEQVGTQRLLRFNFSARVILDLEERFPHEIKFNMVKGDLKAFSGSWRLETEHTDGTDLCYSVHVWPKLTTPVAMIERCICSDLRLNLLAVRQRVEQLHKPSTHPKNN